MTDEFDRLSAINASDISRQTAILNRLSEDCKRVVDTVFEELRDKMMPVMSDSVIRQMIYPRLNFRSDFPITSEILTLGQVRIMIDRERYKHSNIKHCKVRKLVFDNATIVRQLGITENKMVDPVLDDVENKLAELHAYASSCANFMSAIQGMLSKIKFDITAKLQEVRNTLAIEQGIQIRDEIVYEETGTGQTAFDHVRKHVERLKSGKTYNRNYLKIKIVRLYSYHLGSAYSNVQRSIADINTYFDDII